MIQGIFFLMYLILFMAGVTCLFIFLWHELWDKVGILAIGLAMLFITLMDYVLMFQVDLDLAAFWAGKLAGR